MKIIRWNGEKIATPGAYEGIPLSAYHDQICVGPSISSSGLRQIFSESPAHYFLHSPLNPNRVERPDSEALVLGRAAHHLLLGEGSFAEHFVVRPEEVEGKPWHGNRTDCKRWLSAQALAGLMVLKPEHIEKVRGMAEALAADPIVAGGILNGAIETSLVWQDEETGVWLKARPDAIPSADGVFADLKTTTSVDPEALSRTIGDFGYHMQAALVGMAAKHVLKLDMQGFALVFVEKDEPHCVQVPEIPPADLELGERQIRAALRIFKRCLDTNRWPGPMLWGGDAGFVHIPSWARKRAEDRLVILEQEVAA